MRNTGPNTCNQSGPRYECQPSDNKATICNMVKCAVFVANYRGLDRYYNFIFAGRKISREENFAGGKFREIPFAVDIIFAGGKLVLYSRRYNIGPLYDIILVDHLHDTTPVPLGTLEVSRARCDRFVHRVYN